MANVGQGGFKLACEGGGQARFTTSAPCTLSLLPSRIVMSAWVWVWVVVGGLSPPDRTMMLDFTLRVAGGNMFVTGARRPPHSPASARSSDAFTSLQHAATHTFLCTRHVSHTHSFKDGELTKATLHLFLIGFRPLHCNCAPHSL